MSRLNKTGRHCQAWRRLAGWERRTLVTLAALLPATWLGLRVLGVKRMLRIAECPLPAGIRHGLPTGSQDMAHAQKLSELVGIAARHGLYRANCLHQALPLCWLLRREGLPASLKIGVRSGSPCFEAHAWVELGGVALGQSVAEYRPFPRPVDQT